MYQLVSAENDENECREPFTISEAVAHAARIRAIEEPKAESRQGNRTDLKHGAESSPCSEFGKTRDKVAKAVGMSHDRLKKAETVLAEGREAGRYPAFGLVKSQLELFSKSENKFQK